MDFYSAVDRASLLTQGKEQNIVKMETQEDKLMITSFSSEIGRTEETITIEKNEGANVAISFSAKYMMDALKTIDDTELVVFLNSEIKPIVIKSAKDETLVQLILPIKTYSIVEKKSFFNKFFQFFTSFDKIRQISTSN